MKWGPAAPHEMRRALVHTQPPARLRARIRPPKPVHASPNPRGVSYSHPPGNSQARRPCLAMRPTACRASRQTCACGSACRGCARQQGRPARMHVRTPEGRATPAAFKGQPAGPRSKQGAGRRIGVLASKPASLAPSSTYRKAGTAKRREAQLVVKRTGMA